jgi:RNA 2',3'-cyclic 3'-phosphodiesterase
VDNSFSLRRLFIGIPLPPNVNKALDEYCHQIAKQHRNTRTRFTPTTNRHLTLAFLGTLNQEQTSHAIAVVQGLQHPPFMLELASISRFPDKHSRIITVLPIASNSLNLLHDKIYESLEKKNFEKAMWPFLPHITLARIKNLNDGLPIAIRPRIKMNIAEVILYESLLTETGSIYTPATRTTLELP